MKQRLHNSDTFDLRVGDKLGVLSEAEVVANPRGKSVEWLRRQDQ